MRFDRASLILLSLVLFNLHPVARGQSAGPPTIQQRIASSFSPNGRALASATLSGSAKWIAGSQVESGTATFQVAADGTSSESLSMGAVSRTYVQGPLDLLSLNRTCTDTSAKGVERSVTGPNCIQGVPWFLPSFVLEPSYASGVTVRDGTTADDTSQGLVRFTYTLQPSNVFAGVSGQADPFARLRDATTVTVVYDSQTALPRRLLYQQALDNDDSRSIDISIEFDHYSIESGFMIPHHIQRFVQRTLQLDVIVSDVVIQ